MSYNNLKIEKCYETSEQKNELLEKFYLPFLSETIQYYRIAGFFSSSSLIVASKGIEKLINNNGKMKLLISPRLSEQDYEIIKNNSFELLNTSLSIFDNINIEDFPNNNNLEALAWMLKNGKLEIKIVIDKNFGNSMFHQKIGIGTDNEGNMISFSGSINETAQAWLNNIEEFKTFKSWEPEQMEYLLSDLRKFNAYWNNEKPELAYAFDIPESIKNKIISISPQDVNDLLIMKKYEYKKEENINKIPLFNHQEKAIEKWKENNYRLLMEMATGTGKTRAAIGCFLELKDKLKNFLVVVSTPQNTLSRQWKEEINNLNIKFDYSNIIDGSNPNWKHHLEELMLDLNCKIYDSAIIFTTHKTSSNINFLEIINNNKRNTKILFICDEVHAIASDQQKNALLDIYDYRIGLSATPERMFDDDGTGLIKKYFGEKSFEFTIKDALTTINPLTNKPFLNQFYYYPRFIYLNDEELKKYNECSKTIAYLMNEKVPDLNKISQINIKRANITKNAEEKYNMVDAIINELNKEENIKDTIVFVTDKQVEPVLNMLSEKHITRSKITEDESTSKTVGINGNTERAENISQFRKGAIQVLVGIKCLDEGIDIVNARIAILMASSINPRQYIQRVGRVIRPAENKNYSEIYDIIVKTDSGSKADKILEKEAKRSMQIASNAINYDDVKEIFIRNGVEINGDK